jgi:hypothetical protein
MRVAAGQWMQVDCPKCQPLPAHLCHTMSRTLNLNTGSDKQYIVDVLQVPYLDGWESMLWLAHPCGKLAVTSWRKHWLLQPASRLPVLSSTTGCGSVSHCTLVATGWVEVMRGAKMYHVGGHCTRWSPSVVMLTRRQFYVTYQPPLLLRIHAAGRSGSSSQQCCSRDHSHNLALPSASQHCGVQK